MGSSTGNQSTFVPRQLPTADDSRLKIGVNCMGPHTEIVTEYRYRGTVASAQMQMPHTNQYTGEHREHGLMFTVVLPSCNRSHCNPSRSTEAARLPAVTLTASTIHIDETSPPSFCVQGYRCCLKGSGLFIMALCFLCAARTKPLSVDIDAGAFADTVAFPPSGPTAASPSATASSSPPVAAASSPSVLFVATLLLHGIA